jgi:hypothetical protein
LKAVFTKGIEQEEERPIMSTSQKKSFNAPDVTIRPLRESELETADRIFRLAFGTFLGLPNPETFAGDADAVRTRWKADPIPTVPSISIFIRSSASIRASLKAGCCLSICRQPVNIV